MNGSENILTHIIATKRDEVHAARLRIGLDQMRDQAAGASAPRGFAARLRALVDAGLPAVVAEIKKASPSKGVLREQFDPAAIARTYAAHGAGCLSVLTDAPYFQGSHAALVAARSACTIPVLRKDFMIDAYQVYEARAMGADAILLIVAALDTEALVSLEQCAMSLGMDVLIEVHDAQELQVALTLSSPLIGINNRDLRSFETRLSTTLELLSAVPANRLVVTESGIRTPQDVKQMRDAGVHAFLVGETFMRATDPGDALESLFGPIVMESPD